MNKKLHLNKKALLWMAMLCVVFSSFAQAQIKPYNIVMNIYQDPKTQMAFNWFADNSTGCGQVEIVVGETTNHSDFANPFKRVNANGSSNDPVNKAVVTGLSPGTTYSFRVGKTGAWSDSIGRFTTAKTNKEPFTFIYTTDPQAATPDQFAIAQTTTQIAFQKYKDANFWLNCGDLIEEDSFMSQWIQFFATQQDRFLRFPFAPVMGNHDYWNETKNFRRHFNTENYICNDDNGSTYTFIYGDAQFFALNGEISSFAPYIKDVKTWMSQQVANHPDIKWRIVYYHKTVYTGSGHQGDTPDAKNWRDSIAPLFDSLNIDIAFQGHDHIYEVIGPVYNKETVPGSVSNFQQGDSIYPTNLTGRLGGIFDVQKGTLYFLNSSSGFKQHGPKPFLNMPDSSVTGVPNYPSLFTGRLGHNVDLNPNPAFIYPTYSHVSVSTDSIVITTYEIINGTSAFLDKIKVVKDCEPYTHETLAYTGNQSLSNANFVIANELRITNNATVTFTNSTLRFYKDAKVIIEPGSKLIINNTTLSNACVGGMWQGITILGNSRYSGVVQVINNGAIENAITGIDVKTRGIVNADNANFINNTTGVLFESQSLHSSFTLTNFEHNSSYFGAAPFDAHIKMLYVSRAQPNSSAILKRKKI